MRTRKPAILLLTAALALCCAACLFFGITAAYAENSGKSNAVSDLSLNRAGLNEMTSAAQIDANIWTANKLTLESYAHADPSHGADNGLVFGGAEIDPYLETAALYENFDLQFSIYGNDLIRNDYAPNSTFRIAFGEWVFRFPTNYPVLYKAVTCGEDVVIDQMNYETITSPATQMLKFRLVVNDGVADLYYALNFDDDVADDLVFNYYVGSDYEYCHVESEKLKGANRIRIEFDNDGGETIKGKLVLGDIRLINLDEDDAQKLPATSAAAEYAFGGEGVTIETDVAAADFLGVSVGHTALTAEEYSLKEENGRVVKITVGDDAMLRYCLASGNYESASVTVYAVNNSSAPLTFSLKNIPQGSISFVMPEETVVKSGALGAAAELPDISSVTGFVGWYDGEGRLFDTTGLTYGSDLTLYLKTDGDVFSITYVYTDVLGREKSSVFSVPYGTNVAAYGAENISAAETERFGYTFCGWEAENGGDTVFENAFVNAVYEKLSGNGQDLELDFSSRPAAWQINDMTRTHSGGSVSYDGGYFRGYKQAAGSRFVTRQMYTDFCLEFDLVELSGVEYGNGRQQILYLEFAMNDTYLSTYESPMRVIIELTAPEERGDICWVSLDGSTNYKAGTLNRHLYDAVNANIERDGSGAIVRWLSTGVGEEYFVSLRFVMQGGVLSVYSKDNAQSGFSSAPDFTVEGPENTDTTGYVSVAGWSNDPDMEIAIGIDNYKLTNLSPRESELEISAEGERENGYYLHEAAEGDFSLEIDLRGQRLFAANAEIGGEIYSYDGLIREDFDFIVDEITISAKVLAKIYNEHRDALVNGKLPVTVRFVSTSDCAEISLLVGVPEQATLQFYDGETLISSVTKALGEIVSFPEIDAGSRKFIGWMDSEGVLTSDTSVAVTLDETYTAVYEAQYMVTFVDEDGNTLKTEIVNNKEAATPPDVHKRGYRPSWTGDNYLYVTADSVVQVVWTREAGAATGLPPLAIAGIASGAAVVAAAAVIAVIFAVKRKKKA